MTKYRLKKDTPFYKKGTEFCEDWFLKGALLNDDCSIAANLNELDNPDEWFEKVDESSDWLHNGTIYYRPEVGVYDERFLPCSDMFRGTEYDIARQRIGFCHKSAESCRRFIDFLEAVEVVSHDDGFMKISRKINYDTYGYAISHSDWNKSLIAEKVESINHAGQFYFDTSEHAEASLDKHRDEWRTILDYDWSRG